MARLVHFSAPYSAVAQDFVAHGITTDAPGFYDDPAFTAVERRQRDYLNNYAKFVQGRHYDNAYLARANREIPEIAAVLYRELLADGRLGACIDISIMLSKMLNREGLWNYQTKGGLTIEYPPEAGIGTRYFWPVDQGDFATGHSWIVAPPFTVIDLTVKLQPHKGGTEYLPDYVITRDSEPTTASVIDVASPEARAACRGRGIPESKFLARVLPYVEPFWRSFPPQKVRAGKVVLKYVATGISAPEAADDHPGDWQCNARYAGEIYADLIKPHLEALRAS